MKWGEGQKGGYFWPLCKESQLAAALAVVVGKEKAEDKQLED